MYSWQIFLAKFNRILIFTIFKFVKHAFLTVDMQQDVVLQKVGLRMYFKVPSTADVFCSIFYCSFDNIGINTYQLIV